MAIETWMQQSFGGIANNKYNYYIHMWEKYKGIEYLQ